MSTTPPNQIDREDDSGHLDARRKIRFGMLARTVVTMLVVGLLPLALFGGLTLVQQSRRIRSEADVSMRKSAERISAQVDEWFDKNLRVLQTAATLPAITTMLPEEQTQVVTAIQKAYPWMYLVFTVAPDGRNVARSDGKPLTDYSDRQYYKDVALGGKDLSLETLIGRTSKKPALIMAIPIKVGGATVGVMAAAMGIEDISRVVAHWKTGQTGFAFVVDEKAKVVAHPREEFVLSQSYLPDHPLISQFRADGQPHLTSFTETNGEQVLGAVQGNRFHWGVAVQQDERELFAPLRETLGIALALLAGAALLVAVIAWVSSRLLIRPILDMTYAADRMSLGELDAPISVSRHDELGLLAHSLERLRRSMKSAMARLRSAS